MSAPHINLSSVLSVCQTLSNLVNFLRTCDKTILHSFLRHGVYSNTAEPSSSTHDRSLSKCVF